MTPRFVYMGLDGFFLTPMMGRQKVAFNSGCVTWALFILSPIGRMNLSNFGGFLVKLSPTNVTFVTILFQPFLFVLPDFRTLNTSDSDWALEKFHSIIFDSNRRPKRGNVMCLSVHPGHYAQNRAQKRKGLNKSCIARLTKVVLFLAKMLEVVKVW